jgi:hypothetical protein
MTDPNRNPATLRIKDEKKPKGKTIPEIRKMFGTSTVSQSKDVSTRLNEVSVKPTDVANNRPIEGHVPSAISYGLGEYSVAEQRRIKERDLRLQEEREWINWDAVNATFQKADREDLTSSAWRFFKYRFQNPPSHGPQLESITGKEFNEKHPADASRGEAPVNPNKTLNEVQQSMVLSSREENRKLTDRIGRGKDTYSQALANFTAGIAGSITVADVALALVAPHVEAGLIAARWFPNLLKPGLKAMQALRASKGVKGDMAVNVGEHLVIEGATIPMEQIDRETLGLEQYGAAEIVVRAIGGVLFTVGLTGLAHVVKESKFWNDWFKRDPERSSGSL